MNKKNKISKKEKKQNWLKTCCDILKVESLNEKEKKETLKLLNFSYNLLLTDKAKKAFIDELKRKVGVVDE